MAFFTKPWATRSATTSVNLSHIYGVNNAKLFSVKVHHGGKFTPTPQRCYIRGETFFVDYVDVNHFNLDILSEIIQSFSNWTNFFCYFWNDEETLDYGLSRLSSPGDFEYMKTKIQQSHFTIVPQIFMENEVQSVTCLYPKSLLKVPTNRVASLLYDFIFEKPHATVDDAIHFMELKYGITFPHFKMQQGVMLARRLVDAWNRD